jgi:4a-hydroxytetrahydrobiopterin dehydratase
MDLTQQKCVACEGNNVIPFNHSEAEVLIKQVPGWLLSSDAKTINKHYEFKNFAQALEFVNKVGALAESEGHHPNIHMVDYKFVNIDLSTHAIDGLSQNDFILAAKIDEK